ncbi:hypothetical protein MTY_1756 [Moorella thermoacetica Y72]|nr:hypothetical protein MTY_1756 [Moorella thermoacetica Y72]
MAPCTLPGIRGEQYKKRQEGRRFWMDKEREIDARRREAELLGEEQEQKRQQFMRNIMQQGEGVAAEREKFLRDLQTGSLKKL